MQICGNMSPTSVLFTAVSHRVKFDENLKWDFRTSMQNLQIATLLCQCFRRERLFCGTDWKPSNPRPTNRESASVPDELHLMWRNLINALKKYMYLEHFLKSEVNKSFVARWLTFIQQGLPFLRRTHTPPPTSRLRPFFSSGVPPVQKLFSLLPLTPDRWRSNYSADLLTLTAALPCVC